MNIRPRYYGTAALALILPLATAMPSMAQEMGKPTIEMQAVLDKLGALDAKPFSTLAVQEARAQASPADAAHAVQWDKRLSSNPEAQVTTKDIAIPSKEGGLAARVYIPGGNGPFPVVVYYHGGGWVVADINVYDSAPRALAMGANAIVVSVEYRHAPEHKFPAAHDDAWTAYKWVVENIHELNGNSDKIAVAGESAGGNLAANVALMAKDMKTKQPVHQLLVYPVAGNDMDTPSYKENANAKPLGKADMEWFVKNTVSSKDDTKDPRINLNGRSDLAGVAPATVILAQIDPLRSDGETYASKLKDAGVAVNTKTYNGVTHEFFGMGKVVPEAKQAVDLAVADLTAAFAKAK
ncbi:alpha/beta hydrolase [Agrobacterium rosae]|uniref:Lipase n=1 Tax=Agrobacterium rosae TaxID=1972867 RepID=A0AAE5RTL3_9HYPH|nr:alpha/beta hydrolase [Agrobacterium rosae]KAA3507872.1 alpha/beta hydrolase [Agrobacterium rosae]KAA3512851.1 alpha/beta hydrolase [Agrobacterium rosae]MQB51190.1 alpha/beta hydrolase [Agrobacterium rosae]POO49072.1 lipase [Agrobacterium rosae]